MGNGELSKLVKMAKRPSRFSAAIIRQRQSQVEVWNAISAFEGQKPTEEQQQLFQLLAQGKISRQEYLDICIGR